MNWFKNARTVTKLMIAFGLMAAVLAGVGYQAVGTANTLNSMLNVLYEKHMLGLSAAQQGHIDIALIGREIRQALLERDRSAIRQFAESIENRETALETNMAAIERSAVTEDGRATAGKIREMIPPYRAMVNKVLEFVEAGNTKAALDELVPARAQGAKMEQLAEHMVGLKVGLGKKFYEDSDTIFRSARATLLATIAIGILGCLALGVFIARLISAPLAKTVTVLEQVAAGDLTHSLDVSTSDEVGIMAKALNQAVANVRETLGEVQENAAGVALAAQELASASEELSAGAQEQASSQEETSATMEEISSTVKQNAESARHANQLAAGAQRAAENGGEVVSAAVAAMGEINASSKRIAEIITTIDEIAFQTNLLALNAAVEAARAGEQGRGFAVVASEVRNLAQRSATAAKEIKGLIQDSVRKVENGSELVNNSGRTLQEIVGSVRSVTELVAEIAAACQEQAAGIEQIGKAMLQMDQVTQTNSAQTEELSSTAQTLALHTDQMQNLVGRFILDSGPRRDSRAESTRPWTPAAGKRHGQPGAGSIASLARLSQATARVNLAAVPAGEGEEV